MRETIVVTGGAGYIGSHIGYLLAQKGYHVIVLDKLVYHQSTAHLTWATVRVHDYGDANVLDALFKEYDIKAIVHCAALIEDERSVKEPHEFYENNVVKTITLLDRMRAHGIPYIIFSSSCAVYGSPHVLPIPEDHPQNPISPYGNTKHMIELILKDYDLAYGIRHVSLCLAHIIQRQMAPASVIMCMLWTSQMLIFARSIILSRAIHPMHLISVRAGAFQCVK